MDEVGGNVLIEPSVEEHVADGGRHGDEVETEEREIVISEKRSNEISFDQYT